MLKFCICTFAKICEDLILDAILYILISFPEFLMLLLEKIYQAIAQIQTIKIAKSNIEKNAKSFNCILWVWSNGAKYAYYTLLFEWALIP